MKGRPSELLIDACRTLLLEADLEGFHKLELELVGEPPAGVRVLLRTRSTIEGGRLFGCSAAAGGLVELRDQVLGADVTVYGEADPERVARYLELVRSAEASA